MCKDMQKPEEGGYNPWSWSYDSCEPPHMGAGTALSS